MLTLIRSASPKAVLHELKGAGPFRLLLGAIGVFVIGYGGLRTFQHSKDTKPFELIKWLIGALIVHDAIIAPITVAVGWLIARYIPRRARPFVQSGLAIAGATVLFALPLIHRRGKSGPGSALVKQNYTGNLIIILVVIAAVTIALYVLRVVRQRPISTNVLPPVDQESTT